MTVGVGFPAYRCAPCVGPVHHHLVCTLGLQQDADVPNEARLMLRADLDQCTAARERGQGTRRVSEFRMNRYAQTTTGRSVMRSAPPSVPDMAPRAYLFGCGVIRKYGRSSL